MKAYNYIIAVVSVLCLKSIAQTCDTSEFNRTNLGLYGGAPKDISFSPTGRMFASVLNPTTLYYSDDTANTWLQAFPIDSLEFECGERGWGGNGMKVLANNKNWILARTTVNAVGPQENRTSCEVSFSNGDTGTWRTFIDEYLIEKLTTAPNQAINNIALTDYYLYAITANMIFQADSALNYTITDIKLAIPYLGNNFSLASISASNSSQGIPYYLTIDTTPTTVSQYDALLFKYDGSVFTKLNLPTAAIKGCFEVFVHPASTTGDTLFISSDDTVSQSRAIFKSVDGGQTWTNISFPNTFVDLQEVDYSDAWKAHLPLSNGAILMIRGVALSYDLGNTWKAFNNINADLASAVHPADTAIIAGTMSLVHLSSNGSAGPFVPRKNTGMEALEIKSITSGSSKGIYYLATDKGIAYTTAYSDTTVAMPDKWQAPYGKYPLSTVSGEMEGLAMNPSDSLHVVAVSESGGIYLTTNGPDNFSNVFETNSMLKDIKFVTTSVLIAAGDSLFLSPDGGLNWMNNTPAGLSNANTIAVGKSVTDTVIYIGTGEMDITSSKIIDTAFLWKSFDQGNNWVKWNTGPQSISDTSLHGIKITDIAVVSGTTDNLYILAGNEGYKSVCFSPDGGSTYEYPNIVDSFYSYSSLLITDPDSSILIAAGRRIYEYVPILDTAHIIYIGLPSEEIPSLAKGSILAGTTTGFYSIGFEPMDDLMVGIKNTALPNSPLCTLYPNPFFTNTSSKLAFKNCLFKGRAEINISDVYGKIIWRKTISEFTDQEMIQMNQFKPGTYMITILTRDYCHTQKIILF
jgi:hypothetical protein